MPTARRRPPRLGRPQPASASTSTSSPARHDSTRRHADGHRHPDGDAARADDNRDRNRHSDGDRRSAGGHDDGHHGDDDDKRERECGRSSRSRSSRGVSDRGDHERHRVGLDCVRNPRGRRRGRCDRLVVARTPREEHDSADGVVRRIRDSNPPANRQVFTRVGARVGARHEHAYSFSRSKTRHLAEWVTRSRTGQPCGVAATWKPDGNRSVATFREDGGARRGGGGDIDRGGRGRGGCRLTFADGWKRILVSTATTLFGASAPSGLKV